MEFGKIQNLTISRMVDFGCYLIDDEKNEVLLPKKQMPKGAAVGEKVSVFVYKDSKGRLISTTKKPFLTVGEVAHLTVVDVSSIGAFLNIGLERDLFLPYSEQTKRVHIGDKVDVMMYVDKSSRLSATMYLKNKNIDKKIKNSTIRTNEYEQNAERIYKIIKEKFKGHLVYTDKNVSPEKVMQDFDCSKNVFKNSIGKLLKDNKIKITDKGIFTYY